MESSKAPAYIPKTSALQVNMRLRKQKRPTKRMPEACCALCETRGNWGQDCQQITDIKERIEILKANNWCFLCLNRRHAIRQSPKKSKAMCSACKVPHDKSICNADWTNDTPALPANVMSVSKVDVTLPNFTYFQIVRVRVVGPTGLSKLARCILDSRSQTSFISIFFIDALKLEVTDQRHLAFDAFESPSITSSSRRQVRTDLRVICTNSSMTITA